MIIMTNYSYVGLIIIVINWLVVPMYSFIVPKCMGLTC